MRNRFEVHGDAVVIELRRRNGSIMETIIDLADLSLVQSFPGTWSCHIEPKQPHLRYVYGDAGSSRKPSTRLRAKLHRWITQAPTGLPVDHKSGDGLDNRRYNLRIATQAENMQNQVVHRRSRSGIRGVRPNGSSGWQAFIYLNYRYHCLGNYPSKEKAAVVAAQARAKMMPFSREARELQTREV